jgi:hypothetical protein
MRATEQGAGDRQDFMDTLLCPNCAAQLKNPGTAVGQDLQCPRCNAVFSGKDEAETHEACHPRAGELTAICDGPILSNSAVRDVTIAFHPTLPAFAKPMPKLGFPWPSCSLLLGMPVLGLVVAGFIVCNSLMVTTKEDRAKMDTKALQTVVTSYYASHEVYPNTLDELTQVQPDGSPALVDAKGLIDPWGNPYIYDPTSRHPKTDRPLIYSNGPPGQNKRISNWD